MALGMAGVALALAGTTAAGQGPETMSAAAPPGPAGPGRDGLFQQVFGQRAKPQRVRQLDLPVKLEGREIGLVPARLSGNPKDTQVDMAALAALLADRAQEEPVAALRALAGQDGFGRVADVPADGLAVAYEAADLSIAVSIPPPLRRVVRLDVTGRSDAARGMLVLPPATFSAYVNMRAAVDFLASPDPGRADGRGPLSVVFEPAANWRGWVFEGEAYYRENGLSRWSRGPLRIVRDLPDRAIRVQAGDVFYPVLGSQTGRPLGGLSVARNFSLQPYRSVQPAGQRDFVLEAPSLVEVFVNGRPTRSYRLDPGPYNISNFPGASGTNDIQIRITDAFGRTQAIEFPFFFDSQLLAAGVQEFAYTAGYPYTTDTRGVSYVRERLSFSGFHRVGVTDALTLGAGLQADKDQQILSGEALLATPFGTFGIDPQVSVGPDATGYALTLRYRDYRSGEALWRQRTVTGQVTWRDNAFASFGTLRAGNPTSLDASLRISQPLLDGLTATLGARWRETRDPDRVDGYAVDFTLRRRIGRNGSVDLTLSHDRDDFGEVETGAYFSVRYSFDDAQYNAGFSIDTVARERRLDLRYQSPYASDQWSLAVDATNAAGGDRLQGSAGYVHQRFLANVRHDAVERALGGGRALEHRTQASVATALAFADGHVGVTRPISNSFAIVVPHPRIADKPIGVDPINDRYTASSGWLGPAVLPNIAQYLIRPLQIDVLEVPPTYDVGEDRPAVQPGYRTGTVVPIGTDATASLDGVMRGPDGEPVSLHSGVLEPVGAADGRAPVQFFTNRRGRFRVESVRPGDWTLRVYGIDAPPVPISVPREAEGVLKIGEIHLTRSK